MNLNDSKAALRQTVREKIKAMPPEQRAALSGRACALSATLLNGPGKKPP